MPPEWPNRAAGKESILCCRAMEMKRTSLFAVVLATLFMIGIGVSLGAGTARTSAAASMGVPLTWTPPPSATQYHLQVTPFGGDGPGINVIRGVETGFLIPSPPAWYGLLPDMGYDWRVRFSGANQSIGENDSSWGDWQGAGFRTPIRTSAGISALQPENNTVVGVLTPILQWANTDTDVFYYEVQVSSDPEFGPNAFRYHVLIHGGVSSPPNTYRVPSEYPLRPGLTYFWRIRPRVQGDGTPVTWSTRFTFRTPTTSAVTTPVPVASTPTPTPIASATSVRTATPLPTLTPTVTAIPTPTGVWERVTVPIRWPSSTKQLYGIAVLDEATIWIVGYSGVILRTNDGGATWTQQNSGLGDGDPVYGISAVDGTTAWAVGSRTVMTKDGPAPTRAILKTTDSGNSWTSQSTGESGDVSRISAVNTSTAWAVSSTGILKTSNGGITWETQILDTNFRGIAGASANVAWGLRNLYKTTGDGGVYKTTTGGALWLKQATIDYPSGVAALDERTAWVVGLLPQKATGPAPILKTIDGVNWTAQNSGTDKLLNSGNGLRGIAAASNNVAWAGGQAGTIIFTNDGGVTWVPQSSGTSEILVAVATVKGGNFAWAVSENGTVLRTKR